MQLHHAHFPLASDRNIMDMEGSSGPDKASAKIGLYV